MIAGSFFFRGATSVRVIGAYFPNGRAPAATNSPTKWRLHALREQVRTELVSHPELVLMGDFNITFDDADV